MTGDFFEYYRRLFMMSIESKKGNNPLFASWSLFRYTVYF